MALNDTSGPCSPTSALLRWLLRLLTLVALCAASYLGWVSLAGGADAMIGCGGLPQFDCGHVLAGRWSYWLYVPVSLPAVGVYGAMFVATWLIGLRNRVGVRRAAWAVLLLGAILAAGAGLWFLALLVFAAEKLCSWCILVHTCGLICAGLILCRLLRHRGHGYQGPDRQWLKSLRSSIGDRGRGKMLADTPHATNVPGGRWLVGVGVIGLAALIGGQLLFRPPGYKIEEFEEIGQGQEDPQIPPPDSQVVEQFPSDSEEPARPDRHRVSILGGKVVLDSLEYPILGDPGAEYVLVDLSDYTCKHCRKLHGYLKEVRSRYGEQLAVLMLPMPMNRDCNQFVRSAHPDHEDACHYARLAVAVWRLDRTKFETFHDWLFEPERPPSVSDATEYAGQLVGSEAMEKELDGPGVDETMQRHVRLYNRTGRGPIPQLLFERWGVRGKVDSPEKLYEILELRLGIKPVEL